MKIKICGLTCLEDIDMVNVLLPDYIGFVFAESNRKVTRAKAESLKRRLCFSIKAVGVFVNHPIEEIIDLCERQIVDLIQLHGDEDISYFTKLKDKVTVPIIKAVRVQTEKDCLTAKELPYDYLLFDSAAAGHYGGTGKNFNWTLIPPDCPPFFLAGGLTPETIPNTAVFHPYCVDISSGVETNLVKDPLKVKRAIAAARSVE